MGTGYESTVVGDHDPVRDKAAGPGTFHRGTTVDGCRAGLRAHLGLLVVIIVGVALPVLFAALTGNLSIPHNDAWSYSRIAQTFARTGHIELLGWNRSTLVGQFIPLGPLGASITVQQLFVALLGAVSLAAVHDLVRPTLGTRRAAFAALLVAFWPGFGLLATSFMPDVPALAATLVSISLGRRALARDSIPLLALATAVGLWGVTIRAQVIAAPAALLLYAFATRRSRQRISFLPLCVAAAVSGAVLVAVNTWYNALPNSDAPTYTTAATLFAGADNTAALIAHAVLTMAFPLAPAIVLAARPWRWRLAAKLTSVATLLMGVAAVYDFGVQHAFLGNYLAPQGPYAGVLLDGDNRIVFSRHVWWVIVAGAVVSASLLTGLLVQKGRGLDRLLLTFTAVTALGTVATNVVGQSVFDRYLISMAPGVLAVVLAPGDGRRGAAPEGIAADRADRGPGRPHRIAALAALAGTGLVSIAILAGGFSFDAQRWQVATALTGRGVAADQIDAGLEWLGYHSPSGVVNRYPAASLGFEGYFYARDTCYVVTAVRQNRSGWTLQSTTDYRTFYVAGTSKLYVYATNVPQCG